MLSPYSMLEVINQVIEDHDTTDPYRIAREKGAILLEQPLKGVNGFYWRHGEDDLIIINESLSEEEKILVVAHELGHMILHGEDYEPNILLLNNGFKNVIENTQEREANGFAVMLLRDKLNLNTDIPLLNWRVDGLHKDKMFGMLP